MKSRILFILLALIVTSNLRATEVNFRAITWDQALKAATTEHKYIFVDGFTEWCYWCKVLDKNTFSDEKVAEFMNSHFVCLKLDMERDFGKIFAMKYRVNSYPTQLMFNAAGKLVYVSAGYEPPEGYLKMLAKSVEKNEQVDFKGISNTMNLAFPDFYKAAFDVNDKRKFPDSLQVDKYLDTQKDMFSEVNWSVMYRFTLNEKHNAHILSNAAKYATLYGKDNVSQKLYGMFYVRTNKAGEAGDAAAFQNVLADVDKYSLSDKAEEKKSLKKIFYVKTKDWNSYATMVADELAAQNFNDAAVINEYCWTIYEKCDDAGVVTKAIGWMKHGVDKEPSYANLDTYASLLFKGGQLDEAEKQAKLAIEKGKSEKAEVKATEELLIKIGKGRAAQ